MEMRCTKIFLFMFIQQSKVGFSFFMLLLYSLWRHRVQEWPCCKNYCISRSEEVQPIRYPLQHEEAERVCWDQSSHLSLHRSELDHLKMVKIKALSSDRLVTRDGRFVNCKLITINNQFLIMKIIIIINSLRVNGNLDGWLASYLTR